jgi:hypothetical protein
MSNITITTLQPDIDQTKPNETNTRLLKSLGIHQAILYSFTDTVVCKPILHQNEARVYEHIFDIHNQNNILSLLQPIVPHYMGQCIIDDQKYIVLDNITIYKNPIANINVKDINSNGNTDHYHRYTAPYRFMDLKIGAKKPYSLSRNLPHWVNVRSFTKTVQEYKQPVSTTDTSENQQQKNPSLTRNISSSSFRSHANKNQSLLCIAQYIHELLKSNTTTTETLVMILSKTIKQLKTISNTLQQVQSKHELWIYSASLLWVVFFNSEQTIVDTLVSLIDLDHFFLSRQEAIDGLWNDCSKVQYHFESKKVFESDYMQAKNCPTPFMIQGVETLLHLLDNMLSTCNNHQGNSNNIEK